MEMNETNVNGGNAKATPEGAKLQDLVKGIRMVMMTTVDQSGVLRSRPMATQEIEDDGDLWFFTSVQTGKVEQIDHYDQVNVCYVSTQTERYVSVMGSATVLNDREKMRQLWSPIVKAWFPKGVEDPDLRLIHVKVAEAEYWDSPGGKVGSILGIIKNLVTGSKDDDGGHDKLVMRPKSESAE